MVQLLSFGPPMPDGHNESVRGLRRAPGLPDAVRRALELTGGERVLAAAADADGRWHVGTDRALHVANGSGWHTVVWERVDRARFDDETGRLHVVEVAQLGEPEPTHELALVEPQRLLGLVRDRVTASVLLSRNVPVEGSRGVKVIARRAPAGGPVEWSFWLSRGLQPDDPQVRAAIDQGLADAQAELGI